MASHPHSTLCRHPKKRTVTQPMSVPGQKWSAIQGRWQWIHQVGNYYTTRARQSVPDNFGLLFSAQYLLEPWTWDARRRNADGCTSRCLPIPADWKPVTKMNSETTKSWIQMQRAYCSNNKIQKQTQVNQETNEWKEQNTMDYIPWS